MKTPPTNNCGLQRQEDGLSNTDHKDICLIHIIIIGKALFRIRLGGQHGNDCVGMNFLQQVKMRN